jgi:hypothetical protein
LRTSVRGIIEHEKTGLLLDMDRMPDGRGAARIDLLGRRSLRGERGARAWADSSLRNGDQRMAAEVEAVEKTADAYRAIRNGRHSSPQHKGA